MSSLGFAGSSSGVIAAILNLAAFPTLNASFSAAIPNKYDAGKYGLLNTDVIHLPPSSITSAFRVTSITVGACQSSPNFNTAPAFPKLSSCFSSRSPSVNSNVRDGSPNAYAFQRSCVGTNSPCLAVQDVL